MSNRKNVVMYLEARAREEAGVGNHDAADRLYLAAAAVARRDDLTAEQLLDDACLILGRAGQPRPGWSAPSTTFRERTGASVFRRGLWCVSDKQSARNVTTPTP